MKMKAFNWEFSLGSTEHGSALWKGNMGVKTALQNYTWQLKTYIYTQSWISKSFSTWHLMVFSLESTFLVSYLVRTPVLHDINTFKNNFLLHYLCIGLHCSFSHHFKSWNLAVRFLFFHSGEEICVRLRCPVNCWVIRVFHVSWWMVARLPEEEISIVF